MRMLACGAKCRHIVLLLFCDPGVEFVVVPLPLSQLKAPGCVKYKLVSS